ncbi:antitoxin Xre/MbcA/ParS toxin-binding domain-containing protein [Roseomonas mucosa]|uniref:type II RES/Xre toxin-antitoxin system antitoxin n=1 Tax=Roseomonas mucosa TaxID=207340 RepID=UPI001AD6B3AC|nr:antitoxin Xre/MbcA/ParS toxin-binding domain-containing protein [Roseomonas mucosa]
MSQLNVPADRPRRTAMRRPAGSALSYVEVFRAEPIKRINMIKHGLSAAEAKRILSDLAVTQAVAMRALNISAATMNRKVRGEDRLPPAESERVLGIARLVGQVQAIVEESGRPEGFDAAAWTSRWLSEPLPALGGARPLDLLDTMEGQALVSSTLAHIQGGAYA